MDNSSTLGQVIAQRRAALGLSLKDLGRLVQKEDGHGVSAQYLHDIERNRRTPSPHVLSGLARALGVDPYYLASVAEQCPPEVTSYLREHPHAGPTVAQIFAMARHINFTDWDSLLAQMQQKAA